MCKVSLLIRFLLLALLAGCAAPALKPAREVGAAPQAGSQNPIAEAAILMARNDIPAVRALMRQTIEHMPVDWRPRVLLPDAVVIAYWDQNEMNECAERDKARYLRANVALLSPSYSQAWYILAFTALEQKDFKEAGEDLERGLALEPDHPTLLNEKATLLQQEVRLEEALESNRKVTQLQRCVTREQMSRAWRSQGVSLMDLHRYDDAEAALEQSLKIDPGNKNTLRELLYLEQLRGKKPPALKTEVHRVH